MGCEFFEVPGRQFNPTAFDEKQTEIHKADELESCGPEKR